MSAKVNWDVQALNVVVDDEDDSLLNHDFMVTDENINPVLLGNDRIKILGLIENETTNYETLNHIDIQNVKFFYDKGNKTIFTEIAIKAGNYSYTDGTTYGMAININPFLNPSSPQITDADYVYKFIFNNGTWSEILGVQHTPGEQKMLSTSLVNISKFLNETENYIRMNFHMNRIGSPEDFQAQFFASGNVNIPTGKSYTLTDVIPWIEVPTATISLSLEPEISKVYPQQKLHENIIINSTSKIAHKVQLCQNEKCDGSPVVCSTFCWEFERVGAILIPPSNLDSISAILTANNTNKISQDFRLSARDFQLESAGIFNRPTDISKTWHVRVGEFWSDLLLGILDIPKKYPYIIGIISSTLSFFIGVYVSKHQKPLHSKISKLLKRKTHSQTK